MIDLKFNTIFHIDVCINEGSISIIGKIQEYKERQERQSRYLQEEFLFSEKLESGSASPESVHFRFELI